MKTGARTVALVMAVTALVVASTRSLNAQHADDSKLRFMLPLDVSQGAILDRGEPTPYSLSARLSPMVGFGPGAMYRVGAIGAVTYANPDWEVAGGGRIEVRVLTIGLEEAGIFLGGEVLRGTGDRTPITLLGLVDLAGVIRAALMAGRDLSQDETLLEASVGADLVTLFYLLFPSAAD